MVADDGGVFLLFQKTKYDTIEDMLDNPEFRFLLFEHGTTHNLLKVNRFNNLLCVFYQMFSQG
jgi:hypothetical protein